MDLGVPPISTAPMLRNTENQRFFKDGCWRNEERLRGGGGAGIVVIGDVIAVRERERENQTPLIVFIP